MKTLERLGVTALALVVGAQLATLPALAAKPGAVWGSIELTNVGDEPQATGQAIVKSVKYEGITGTGDVLYSARVSVACQGLTPGATYRTDLGTFTANRKGQGTISGTVRLIDRGYGGESDNVVFDWLLGVDVVRLGPDGSSTLVLMASW